MNVAAAENNADAIRALALDCPGALPAGVYAVLTGHSPLHTAAAHGHVDMIRLLLELGAQLEGVDSKGHTALQVHPLCPASASFFKIK